MPILLEKLYSIRQSRMQHLNESIDASDPEAVNYLIADAINALENLFFILNIPQDGFVSLTPKRDNDGTE